jgi:hypothetical protein
MMTIHQLSDALNTAIENNDLKAIEASRTKRPATKRRDEIDQCLVVAVPRASLQTIQFILQQLPRLKSAAYYGAIERGPEVLQLFLDAGWDIDTTEFGLPPVL